MNFPDLVDSSENQLNIISKNPLSVVYPTLFQNLEPIESNFKRGKLLAVEKYDASNKKVEVIENQYDFDKPLESVFSIKSGSFIFYKHIRCIENIPIKSYEKTTYPDGLNPITETVSYTYNNLGQIATTETADSHRNTIKSFVRYVHEKSSKTADEQFMLTKNMYASVWRTYTMTRPYLYSALEFISGAKQYTYKQYTYGNVSFVKPSKVEVGNLSQNTLNIAYVTFYPEEIYDNYSSKGRLIQSTDRTGVSTSFLWGYNEMYPIAVVVNANISTISSTLGGANIGNNYFSNGMNSTQESLIRSIPNTMVETYGYTPGVGRKLQKDASGRLIYYYYNSNHKLSRISDEVGTLKEYTYSSDIN